MGAPTIQFDPSETIIPRKSTARFIRTKARSQVETATAVGTITTAGDATVTVTAAGLTGSPLATTVAVALDDNENVIASKIRTALAAVANITSIFVVGGAGPEVVLTKRVGGANDDTLNIEVDNDDSVGITADAVSDATVAGAAAGETIEMIGKVSGYDQSFTTVKRKVPSPIDGLLRADRNVAIEQDESISMEIEDLKSTFVSIFGGLNGGFEQGEVQLYVVDPDDEANKTALKSNYHRCSAEMEGGLAFKAGEVAMGKIKFTALERMILTPDAIV